MCRHLPSRSLSIVFLSCALAGPAVAAESAADLLARSIAHHDPEGRWGGEALILAFDESRPDGTVRRTEVEIDGARERFTWSSARDGRAVGGRLDRGGCELEVDGVTGPAAEKAEALGLSCDTLTRRRDYYTYLWGLPMKLRDPGTRLDEEVAATSFEGREVLALRVTYDEAVGSDIWYFYFDPSTAALVGYRFHHDESVNDGEYITLDGEAEVGGMKLPKTRAWYYNKDDGYLGTDSLVGGSGGRVVRDGVLISRHEPELALDVAADFVFAGRHRFRIRDVAAGERFVFVEAEGREIQRLLIVQFERFLPGVDDIFRYDLSAGPVVAGYRWRSNGFAFDLGEARAANPAGESPLTAALLEAGGYTVPEQWMMWRSLTVTHPDRKSEVIVFYVEDVASAGVSLEDLSQDDGGNEIWRDLQAGLEGRARLSYSLTGLDADGSPIDAAWARLPE